MHFGENQLSRSLIGLSPLPTAHPLSFQPKWVRSSTRSYPRFNLAMGRSLRFGSRPVSYTHLRAHETVLDLVCRLLLEKKKTNDYLHTTPPPATCTGRTYTQACTLR